MEKEIFINLCKKYNLNIDDNIFSKLEDYYNFLKEENEKYNLTAITEKNEVYIKHFLDSMIGSKFINHNSKVLDIGCGAGFPSVPLAIMGADSNFYLIDAVNKKVNFVNMLINLLGLKNIEAIHSRCEDLAKTPKYRENFDIVVARAVASMNVLLEYCIPFLKIGGKCVLYKGINYQEEIQQCDNALKKLNCRIFSIEKCLLRNWVLRGFLL